jgi:hypothetical protein
MPDTYPDSGPGTSQALTAPNTWQKAILAVPAPTPTRAQLTEGLCNHLDHYLKTHGGILSMRTSRKPLISTAGEMADWSTVPSADQKRVVEEALGVYRNLIDKVPDLIQIAHPEGQESALADVHELGSLLTFDGHDRLEEYDIDDE